MFVLLKYFNCHFSIAIFLIITINTWLLILLVDDDVKYSIYILLTYNFHEKKMY